MRCARLTGLTLFAILLREQMGSKWAVYGYDCDSVRRTRGSGEVGRGTQTILLLVTQRDGGTRSD